MQQDGAPTPPPATSSPAGLPSGAPPAAGGPSSVPTGVRRMAVGLAVGRYASAFLAIPLIPWLLRTHLPLLVLLQPRREWLLLGGAQWQLLGRPTGAILLAAYIPFMVLGVWAFFAVGRAYRPTLRSGSGPRWTRRALSPGRLERWQGLLARRGPHIAVIGRLAAIPPTLLAAAAGLSDVPTRRYLLADLAGALLTFAVIVGAGFGLGGTYRAAGPWLAASGLALLLVLLLALARWVRREAGRCAPAPERPRGSASRQHP